MPIPRVGMLSIGRRCVDATEQIGKNAFGVFWIEFVLQLCSNEEQNHCILLHLVAVRCTIGI